MAKSNATSQKSVIARKMIRMRLEWFGKRVVQNVNIGMGARVRLAAQLLRDATVVNLSRPVIKEVVRNTKDRKTRSRTRVVPSSRSKPGEFPRADTTRLMKDIFFLVARGPHENRAIVGTNLDYGLILETRKNRSFLRRTLFEMRFVTAQLLGTGKGGGVTHFLPGQDG